ncbi:hypothetical protein [Wenyingzhuangia sp. 2_MG-2023]|nr:hypothetical protein [Wenyingzhuangia sp. 2_MG-2023]MDO6738227.1 hypothetical protein [Wenyingzhuangia sp. 2_MG-2023]
MKLLSILSKLGIICLLIAQFSCRKDFDTIVSNGNLSFSVDTLFLDTVFNNLSTRTNILTVYNQSNNDILIPKIQFSKSDSKYRMNVDGVSGTTFEDVLLLQKDSIFIFVEATVDAPDTNDEMLYQDQILFDPNGNQQDVDLITVVKDATFLFSTSGTDFELTTSLFTNTKPYVIYGNAIVPENGSLTIEAGSTLHFHENASLTISKGATLNIEGTLTDSIVFKGDNLSYIYDQVPGQWDGIKLKENSTANIHYLKILNPTTGVEIVNNNTIDIQNTEIYNAATYSIAAENANLTASNLVLGQAGKSNLILQGGTYTFNHATLANYWSKGVRFQENVVVSNYKTNETNEVIETPLNQANFNNCIISGNRTTEILMDKKEDFSIFNVHFKNCLLDLEKDDDFYNTDDTNIYTDVLLNKNKDFRNTSINDLRIGLENEGIDQAETTIAQATPTDILGTDRTVAPDIGAYQHIDFKTLEPTKEDE